MNQSPAKIKARRLFLGSLCWGGAALALGATGCVPRAKTPAPPTSGTQVTARSVDELTLGFESLRNVNNPAAIEQHRDGTRTNSSASRAVFYFNQWLSHQDVDAVPWKLDPMFERTPQAIRKHPVFARFDSLEFNLADITYLQQCLWLNDIAQRVTLESAPAALAPWLAKLEQDGKLDGARQLRQAERLFDWTVRNVQQEPLLPPPKGPELTAEEQAAPEHERDNRPPAQRGIPGPGYQQLPKQTLVNGRGDAWERGRIFILLCRQAGIPAMMLGMVRDNELAGPQAWAAAVLIGEELYLFDPLLGLPIPGPDGQGIATLNQFVTDEGVRKQLNVPGGPEYGVTAEDLKNVGVLLDAQPEALLRRMAILEGPINEARARSRTERKPDDEQDQEEPLSIVLTYQPSELEPKLRRLKHVSTVGLWRVPFEAIFFAQAMPEVVAKSPELGRQLQERDLILNKEEMVYLGETLAVDRSLGEGQQQKQRTPRAVTLNQGRDYLLRGKFEDYDGRSGARSVLLSFRPSAKEIELHESSPDFLRKKYGPSIPLPEDQTQRAEVLQRMGRLMRSSKNSATYWLGLTYFETGQYADTIEWMGRLEPDSRGQVAGIDWDEGARYMMARSYEALGKFDKARELYLADDSPQANGNKLRAAWLNKTSARAEQPKEEKHKDEKTPLEPAPAKPD